MWNMFDWNYFKYTIFSKSVSLYEHCVFLFILLVLFLVTNQAVMVGLLFLLVALYSLGKFVYTDDEDIMVEDVKKLIQTINVENQDQEVLEIVNRLKDRLIPEED